MNERVVELYKEALRFAYDAAPDAPSHIISTLSTGRFSELIIQQCIRAAETTPEMRKSGAANRIKEVFGIEE